MWGLGEEMRGGIIVGLGFKTFWGSTDGGLV